MFRIRGSASPQGGGKLPLKGEEGEMELRLGQQEPLQHDSYKGFRSFFNVPSSLDLPNLNLSTSRESVSAKIVISFSKSYEEECKNHDTDSYSSHSHQSIDDRMICLELLESNHYGENRRGMERLVAFANSDLVNSRGSNSICYALVCGSENSEYATRLQNVFLSYFCDVDLIQASPSFENVEDSDSDSCYSDIDDAAGRHMGELRLPALRAMVSSLELVAGLERTEFDNVDLLSPFWCSIVLSMSQMLEVVSIRPMHASLSIKCIRLLYSMDPDALNPVLTSTLMPFLLHAYEYGQTKRNKMLERESLRLLKSLGVAP
jgi:hypothetical protein